MHELIAGHSRQQLVVKARPSNTFANSTGKVSAPGRALLRGAVVRKTGRFLGQLASCRRTRTMAVLVQDPVSTPDQTVNIPVVQLPAQTAQAFKQQFESLQHELDWMQDTAAFEHKARAVWDSTCQPGFLQPLTELTTEASAPSAILLTGLPVEDNLPPSVGDPPIAKVASC